MIAIFTNCNGDVNRGVVLDIHPEGLFQIKWEPFTALIEKIIKRNPAQSEIAYKSLGERVGWSRPHSSFVAPDDTDELLTKYSKSSLVVVPETGDSPELMAKFKMFGMVTNASL